MMYYFQIWAVYCFVKKMCPLTQFVSLSLFVWWHSNVFALPCISISLELWWDWVCGKTLFLIAHHFQRQAFPSSFPSSTGAVQSRIVVRSMKRRINLIKELQPFACISQIPKCLFCSLTHFCLCRHCCPMCGPTCCTHTVLQSPHIFRKENFCWRHECFSV